MFRIIAGISAAVCLAFSGASAVASNGESILIIGDSNTEYSLISLALTDTLQKYHGVVGSGPGYIPMDSSFYGLRNKRYAGFSGVAVSYNVAVGYNAQWTRKDMFEGTRLAAPHQSPNGQWLQSATQGAVVAVTFPGTALDLYWLARPAQAGGFSIAVDGVVRDTISTLGARKEVRKTSITGLSAGSHTLSLKVTSASTADTVVLLGFEARNVPAGVTRRSVVHNWGNGYASTRDFLDIDSVVFATGLQALNPDVIAILLGTNDHVQDKRSAPAFKANLIRLINRVKAAGVTQKILLISTFNTGDAATQDSLPKYLATSFPEAASETGVSYWDMGTWFGAYSTTQMENVYHCNTVGCKKIGVEMLKQVLADFPTSLRADANAKPSTKAMYSGGRLTLNAASHSVEWIRSDGLLLSRITGSGPRTLRPGAGPLSGPPGLYFLRVRAGGETFAWKVVLLP